MKIEIGTEKHLEAWAQIRTELWPRYAPAYHQKEIIRSFLSDMENYSAYMALNDAGTLIGFAEAAVRHDFVNGCSSSPVLFLEGIYVRPAFRHVGVARSLCNALAAWGRAAGYSEFASDALLENSVSHKFHVALGFKETERVVFFQKPLED